MKISGFKLPLIIEGDDLVKLILEALNKEGMILEDDDIVVVTEKIVAKSQGRLEELDSIIPSEEDVYISKQTGKDPRLVHLILKESNEILKIGEGVIITETRDGYVCANTGIDSSNIEEGMVKLLPRDPDLVAERMRKEFEIRTGKKVGIVIADSFGRPFRSGSTGVAIGVAGIISLWDRRGDPDLFGRALQSTRVAVADCIASAANLVTGDGAESIPVVLVKGLKLPGKGKASDLIREKDQDLFRQKD
jgi:coenzyme F420-0:L-glutamate ligase/coenzyme F420-1:gamma-L-glutamate ligase